jgi:large subunit ribosomal protein L18e
MQDTRLQEEKIAVLVGTITDDVRFHEVPSLKVAALRFTETARARILKVPPHLLSLFSSLELTSMCGCMDSLNLAQTETYAC